MQMNPSVKLVFEVEDLNNASLATVSRAGIVYMNAAVLGWKPIVQSWLAGRRPAEAVLLLPLFDKYVDQAFAFLQKECVPVCLKVM